MPSFSSLFVALDIHNRASNSCTEFYIFTKALFCTLSNSYISVLNQHLIPTCIKRTEKGEKKAFFHHYLVAARPWDSQACTSKIERVHPPSFLTFPITWIHSSSPFSPHSGPQQPHPLFNCCHPACQLSHHEGTCALSSVRRWMLYLTSSIRSPPAMPESQSSFQMPQPWGSLLTVYTNEWQTLGSDSHLLSLHYLLDHIVLLKNCGELAYEYSCVLLEYTWTWTAWVGWWAGEKNHLAALQNLRHALHCSSLLYLSCLWKELSVLTWLRIWTPLSRNSAPHILSTSTLFPLGSEGEACFSFLLKVTCSFCTCMPPSAISPQEGTWWGMCRACSCFKDSYTTAAPSGKEGGVLRVMA